MLTLEGTDSQTIQNGGSHLLAKSQHPVSVNPSVGVQTSQKQRRVQLATKLLSGLGYSSQIWGTAHYSKLFQYFKTQTPRVQARQLYHDKTMTCPSLPLTG